MQKQFLNKPDPPHNSTKRRAEESSGAAPGMPQFLKGGARSKWRAGKPGDSFEQQADRTAAAAFSHESMALAPASGPGPSPTELPAADSGSPLDPALRGRIEPAVGADLSHVRVHDADSDRELAHSWGARAFTHGPHIWMGPGESRSDLALMAHEAAHVVQQAEASAAPAIQKQSQTAVTSGTPAQVAAFVTRPSAQTDPGLRAALTLLNRYSPTVDINKVVFRVQTAVPSYVGTGLFETASSRWEGATPVINLEQDDYDTIARHLAGLASVAEVHEVIRTVGHEMYHLYRDKTGNQANPIKPLYDAEAARRMEEIRQNWLKFAQDPGGAKALGIPAGSRVAKWEDIPEAERKKIEAGATDTAVIQGLYEQTAYLVEETYVKMEEVSYIRIQQGAETGDKHPSYAVLSGLANLLYRFNIALDNSVHAADFMTAAVLSKTRAAMLDYLRKRYPHRADTSLDSYEVVFYLSAINYGGAPHYDSSGALVSAKPPGARVP